MRALNSVQQLMGTYFNTENDDEASKLVAAGSPR